jgi:hypothetical protein
MDLVKIFALWVVIGLLAVYDRCGEVIFRCITHACMVHSWAADRKIRPPLFCVSLRIAYTCGFSYSSVVCYTLYLHLI